MKFQTVFLWLLQRCSCSTLITCIFYLIKSRELLSDIFIIQKLFFIILITLIFFSICVLLWLSCLLFFILAFNIRTLVQVLILVWLWSIIIVVCGRFLISFGLSLQVDLDLCGVHVLFLLTFFVLVDLLLVTLRFLFAYFLGVTSCCTFFSVILKLFVCLNQFAVTTIALVMTL